MTISAALKRIERMSRVLAAESRREDLGLNRLRLVTGAAMAERCAEIIREECPSARRVGRK